MSVLLLQLAGPMQAWGDDSRFTHRATRMMPTKSGVIGMLAAALGRRRCDPVEDLVGLRFGVRQEQRGQVMRDFHTVTGQPLTHRDYLSDAKYLVVLEGSTPLLEGIADAVRSPVFPLYLGRRSCPPSERVLIGIREEPLEQILEQEPWRASPWYRKSEPQRVTLLWSRDALAGEQRDETVRDVPRSFDPRHREYGLRDVVHGFTQVDNPDGRARSGDHDAFALL